MRGALARALDNRAKVLGRYACVLHVRFFSCAGAATQRVKFNRAAGTSEVAKRAMIFSSGETSAKKLEFYKSKPCA
jgi:hypothetical protein